MRWLAAVAAILFLLGCGCGVAYAVLLFLFPNTLTSLVLAGTVVLAVLAIAVGTVAHIFKP